MTSTRIRTAWLVAGSATAGVITAGGLALAAARFAAEGSAGPPPTVQPAAPSPDPPAGSTDALTSTEVGESSDPPTEVTVDVPRSEQAPPAGLVPNTPSPTPWSSSTTTPRPITDSVEAAKAYLVAAESVTGDDTGHRHHRAGPYMAPGNPAATTGLLVTEPPPAGHSRTIEVLAVAPHALNDDLDRIAYGVIYQRHLSPTIPATSALPEGAPRGTFIVVERQPGGDWLVLSQTADLDPTE